MFCDLPYLVTFPQFVMAKCSLELFRRVWLYFGWLIALGADAGGILLRCRARRQHLHSF